MSIASAALSGNRRTTLVAMRDKLAADMDEAAPAVVAQIAARLQAVLADIDSLAIEGEIDLADQLAQRRLDRIAAAKSAESAKRQTRQRGPRSS